MWGTEHSAELVRRLKEMGMLDRWPEIDLDHLESLTGITYDELGGSVSPKPSPGAWSRRGFGERFFPDEHPDSAA